MAYEKSRAHEIVENKNDIQNKKIRVHKINNKTIYVLNMPLYLHEH